MYNNYKNNDINQKFCRFKYQKLIYYTFLTIFEFKNSLLYLNFKNSHLDF